jgi:hypothetical protein
MRTGIKLIPVLSLLLLGLPLAGLAIAGESLQVYFEYPPQTHYVEHAAFSWPVFVLTCIVGLSSLVGIIYLLVRDKRALNARRARRSINTMHWPWWGWVGLLLLVSSWFLAWNRFDWLGDWQRMTFTPIWLGYILVINAWTFRREGQCLLSHERSYFLLLFPLSSLFWWYFEYLNRFVQNWFYLGVTDFSPVEYTVLASLSFSTVLPAVMSTQQWLRSLFGLDDIPVQHVANVWSSRTVATILLLLSSLALFLLGILPDLLFPFLWFAPLLLLYGLQGIRGEPDLVQEFHRRGWQVVYLPALSALQCGILWELWNYQSVAKWVYEVPFVDRFKIFEMPVAGFTGYLPFGIECLAIALLIRQQAQAKTR